VPLGTPISGTLGSFNVGLTAAAGVIAPLCAQVDGLISAGIGPMQADLNSQLSASLATQATLTLQIGDPTASLQLALASVAQLQAALQAALAFPPVNLSLSAELNAQLSVAATLTARLGAIQLALEVAIRARLGAMNLLGQVQASLAAGPVFAFTFESDGLAVTGGQIQGLFNSGLNDPPNAIAPGDVVYGIVFVTREPSVSTALSAIFSV